MKRVLVFRVLGLCFPDTRSEAKSIEVCLDDGLGAAADKNKAKIASSIQIL